MKLEATSTDGVSVKLEQTFEDAEAMNDKAREWRELGYVVLATLDEEKVNSIDESIIHLSSKVH